jgi:hypothetical protein
MRVRSNLFRCMLIVVTLLGVAFSPALRPVSAATNNAGSFNIVMRIPQAKIYEGDTVSIPYAVEQAGSQSAAPLAPLTPAKASISALLGNAKVTAYGMSGTIIYTAKKAGTEQLTLTFDQGAFGSGTGTASFTVHTKGNFDLVFSLVNEDEQSGGGFREVISGSGSFKNYSDQPLQGTGSVDGWFIMWATNEAFACKMIPPVIGSSTFEISGTRGSTTGRGGPPFTLDLNFKPMSLNASNIQCLGLGDITADMPWPAIKDGDMNGLNLPVLTFPAGGGRINVNQGTLWGVIYAVRK